MDHSPTPSRKMDPSRDSVVSNSDTAVSRESIVSMSSKLLNMESELDKTLRDLDAAGNVGTRSKSHSKSPSASRRHRTSSGSTRRHSGSARHSGASGSANSSRRRSESIDPLASSRRSGSIDPTARIDNDQRVRDLTERLEHLEKENQLLDTKYAQQRKRLNLAKRENDDLRSTLDAAIAEIGNLGEEAKASHIQGSGGSSGDGDSSSNSKRLAEQVALLTQQLDAAQTEIAALKDAEIASREKAEHEAAAADALADAVKGLNVPPPPPPKASSQEHQQPSAVVATQNKDGCSLVVSLGVAQDLISLLGQSSNTHHSSMDASNLDIVVRYGENERRVNAPSSDHTTAAASKEEAVVVLFPLDSTSTVVHLSVCEKKGKSMAHNQAAAAAAAVLATATVELPDYPTSSSSSSSAAVNACLELDEWVAFTPSSLTTFTSSSSPRVQVSLSCVNLGHLASDLANLEVFKQRFPEVEAQAARAESLSAQVSTLRASLDAISEHSSSSSSSNNTSSSSSLLLASPSADGGDASASAAVISLGLSGSDVASMSSSMSFFNGDGPATPPPDPACGGAPSSPALTAAGAGAAAASNPELDHPKSFGEDKHSNGASSGGGSSSQSATAQLMARLKSKAKRQPLVAALACCVAVLLCYVGMMETLHNASTRRIRSKTAAIEREYDRACVALGVNLAPPMTTSGVSGLGAAAAEAAGQLSNCTLRSGALEANATLYGRCSRDLSAERGISEQLLAEIQSRDNKGPGGGGGAGGADSSGGGGGGWWGGGKAASDDGSIAGGGGAGAASDAGTGGTALTAAALYQCRREQSEDAKLMVDATMRREAADQELHACGQERTRLKAAHEAASSEHEACEGRLLKQDAWAASLAATNSVLQGHLRDSNSELSLLHGTHTTRQDEAARCEAALDAVVKAKAEADAAVASLTVRTTKLENGTATLTGAMTELEAQLSASQHSAEALAVDKEGLEESLQKATQMLEGVRQDKATLEGQLKATEAKAKELTSNLKDGEKRLRAFALAEASKDARQSVLERRASEHESAASSAKGLKEALGVRNGELASQLSLALTSKDALEKELAAKSSRLHDLETVVASLNAAERVVSSGKALSREGSGSSQIETCTDGTGGSSGTRLCLKVETAPIMTRAAAAAAGMARSAWNSASAGGGSGGGVSRGEETPGLVAIAGAVAAVWVFAVVMEKRKALYQQQRR